MKEINNALSVLREYALEKKDGVATGAGALLDILS